MHLVAACANRLAIVVGQQAVGHKRNELEAMYRLLERLDLDGQVVTGDAQFTQRELCRGIVARGALPPFGEGQSTHAETGHSRPLGGRYAAPGDAGGPA